MEWPIILAIALGAPIILFAVGLVWYLNISGLYQVIKATRAREKRRAGAVKEKAGA